MPSVCAAYGCTNRNYSKSMKQLHFERNNEVNITLHLFPKDPQRRLDWIKAVRRKDWVPSRTSALCSQHFSEDCFNRTLNVVRLRENACPTIFEAFPSYLKNKVSKRKSPTKRKCVQTPMENNKIRKHGSNNLPCISTTMPSCSVEPSSPVVDQSCEINSGNFLVVAASPSKKMLQNELKQLKIESRRKIKVLQQNKRRLKKKVISLKSVLIELKKKNFFDDDQLQMLRDIGPVTSDLVRRQIQKSRGILATEKYSPELRSFALTMSFYSPKAYNFVRKKFDSCLPHPRTISKWYSTINGEPGFTTEAFVALKEKARNSNHPVLCSLIMDEMAIRQQVEFDGKKVRGYVDIGSGVDCEIKAKEVFVFLVVCINGSWKVPVGYYLIDGLNAEQRANLVLRCLQLISECNIRIVSVTFDGLPCNFQMMTRLGCKFNIELFNNTANACGSYQTWFINPRTNEKVFVFLDACHMIKLVRNAIDQYGVFNDYMGNPVEWRYFFKLNEIQDGEGLHLGNKLRNAHIMYSKQKMKVRLATQLFSQSVSDALLFCENQLKLEEFQNCQGTVLFVKVFNDLFDIFNSKSLKQYGYKKPLIKQNISSILQFLSFAENYIWYLMSASLGKRLISTKRKSGFIGFLISISSLRDMYSELVTQQSLLSYIPTYKLSQDHIELLFASFRSHGGNNNNPTARQFSAIYKKVLVHTELRDVSGNCVPLENISILHCMSIGKNKKAEEIINLTAIKSSLTEIPQVNRSDPSHISSELIDEFHSYCYNPALLTQFTECVIGYISGFVVKHLLKTLICCDCKHVLVGDSSLWCNTLVKIKDRGGLIYPSTDVVTICRHAEKIIRISLAESGGKFLLKKFTAMKLNSMVLRKLVGNNFFANMEAHRHDQMPLDDHKLLLTNAISQKYIEIRVHFICKRSVDQSLSKRVINNKIVLFEGY